MNALYFLFATFVFAFFGILGVIEFARLIRCGEIRIKNIQGWPYDFGPYQRDGAPFRYWAAIIVNAFFLISGFGGIVLLALIYMS